MSAGSYSIIYMYGYNAHTHRELERERHGVEEFKKVDIHSFVRSFI